MGTVRPATTSVQQQSVTSCNNNINNTNNIMLQFALGLALLSVVHGQDDPLAALAQNIPGVPGEDYPIFVNPPDTGFDCGEQIEGYYADQDADCQAFHICGNDGTGSLIKYSFLCPNGTLFNQQYFICDWWFNVDCSQAQDFYSLNADIAAAAAAANDNREGRNLDLSVSDITDIKNLDGQARRKFSG